MISHPVGLILAGVLAGALPGVFGFGGGWLLLPILTFVLGVPWAYASGIALCAIFAGAVAGAVNRVGKECKPHETSVRLAVVTAATIGTVIGKICIRDWFSSWPSAPLLLDAILGLALIMVAFYYFHGAIKCTLYGQRREPKPLRLVGLGTLTLIPAVLSGLTGIGGGVLYMPILLCMMRWNKDNARDVSRLAVLFSALVGCWLYAIGGGVPFIDAAYMFVPSALLGAITSAIRFDHLDLDRSGNSYKTKPKPAFNIFSGVLAIIALVLTLLHAINGFNGALPPGGGGVEEAMLAVIVPLGWGIICGLAQRVITHKTGRVRISLRRIKAHC